MSIIKKDGGADEESPGVAQEKAKSSQQSAAVSRTKLATRVFSDAAKSNDIRGDAMNAHAAKEAEARGNQDPRSTGFVAEPGVGSIDGTYKARGDYIDGAAEDDDGEDDGGDGKSGSSSGGGPSPDLDLSTSEYTSFADSGSGEVISKKDQKAEQKATQEQKAEMESEGGVPAKPKEMKITKADGTQVSVAAPAAAKSGSAAPAAAAAKSGVAAPVAPGKSGGGGKGGGGAPSGPG